MLNSPTNLPIRCNCPVCQEAKQPEDDFLQDKNKSVTSLPSIANVADYQIQALDVGRRWSNPSVMTYSFYNDTTNPEGSYYYVEKDKNIYEVSDAIKNNVRSILEEIIEPVINVDFQEVADSQNSYGRIRIMHSDGPSYAYAYYPSGHPVGGDIHLNDKYENNQGSTNRFSQGPGKHGFETLIHEIGHTLALKHPGDYNGDGSGDPPFLPYDEDHTNNTVMSYNFVGSNAATLLPYDIKALQSIYGARLKNNENTTYSFTSVNSYHTDGGETAGDASKNLKITIWDSGGIDELNLSNLPEENDGYYIDLRDNGIITHQDAYNDRSYKARGDNSGDKYYTTQYGTRIAFESDLENLVNSQSDDYVIANSLSNVFSGYSPGQETGEDVIEGADNWDTLDLSEFNSEEILQIENDQDLILELSEDSSITIKDYFSQPSDARINLVMIVSTTPAFSLSKTQATVSEAGDSDSLTLVLENAPGSQVVFNLSSSDTDEAIVSPATVTFTPEDWDIPQNITITGVDDNLIDGDQGSEIAIAIDTTLSDPAFAVLEGQVVSVTTTDDDVDSNLPLLTVEDIRVVEPNQGPAVAEFTVTLDRPATQRITFNYTTAETGEDNSATAESDYRQISRSTGIGKGQTSRLLRIPLKKDHLVEAEEEFFLEIEDVKGAVVARTQAKATIEDLDLPGFNLTETSANISELGGENQFKVALSGQPVSDVILDVNSSDTEEVTVSPTSLTFTRSNWRKPQTVTLTGVDDQILDGDQVSEVIVSVNSEQSNQVFTSLTEQIVTVNTLDNEIDGLPRLFVNNLKVIEKDRGRQGIVFQATLDKPSSENITFTYSTEALTATPEADYTPVVGTGIIRRGKTSTNIRAFVQGDKEVESDEEFLLRVTDIQGTANGESQGIALIEDNDSVLGTSQKLDSLFSASDILTENPGVTSPVLYGLPPLDFG